MPKTKENTEKYFLFKKKRTKNLAHFTKKAMKFRHAGLMQSSLHQEYVAKTLF
jgi:hypothetical protein